MAIGFLRRQATNLIWETRIASNYLAETPFRLISTRPCRWKEISSKEVVTNTAEDEPKTISAVTNNINAKIKRKEHGRLYAVVHLQHQQYKITTHDIVLVKNDFVPKLGEQLMLNKVLMVGSSDFTLVGRPLLEPDLVKIEAVVIEKTLSRVLMSGERLKRRTKLTFDRYPWTMLRINNIEIMKPVDDNSDEQNVVSSLQKESLPHPTVITEEIDNRKDWIVLSSTGETCVCWHPEPTFPYEHSRPIQHLEPDIREDDSVVKLKHRLAYKDQFRQDWNERNACLNQQTMNLVTRLTHTPKHTWYDKTSSKRALTSNVVTRRYTRKHNKHTLGEIPDDREHL